MDNLRISSSLLLIFAMSCALILHAQSKSRRAPTSTRTSSQANADFETAVKAADEARLARRLDEAIELYKNAVRIRPKWADGWWYLGAIHYEKDLYPEARDLFSKLVELEPARGPAWAMLGLCQFKTGEYDRSLASLERGYSLGLNGNKELLSVVIYHSTLLYVRLGQFEIAFDTLRTLERVDSQKVIEAFGLIMLRMPLLPKEIPAEKREAVLLAGRAGASMAARQIDASHQAFDELLNIHSESSCYLRTQRQP
jgi:tetratricopeptide (TPR) repeat protein